MKRFCGRPAMVILVCLAAMLFCAAAEQTGAYTDVAVLSTTDMHGKCWETDILTGSRAANGMLRVSTAVNSFREAYGADNVILIDNGDLFQGTPVSEYPILREDGEEALFPPAMALCLREIGYTAFVVGNHEFNYDWTVIKKIYRWLEDGGVPTLAANVCFDGTQEGTQAGENVFAPYIVKSITVNGHEHKIGVLGLGNSDITRWDQPYNYPGLRF